MGYVLRPVVPETGFKLILTGILTEKYYYCSDVITDDYMITCVDESGNGVFKVINNSKWSISIERMGE